ncbi:MAG: M23 family metallopeptidase [bacterium]|nr:M23 family metallopeptidase [bacterium]
MSERWAGTVDRWRRRLAAAGERVHRSGSAAAGAIRERWGYLSLVLVVVLTLVTVDLARDNGSLRRRVDWYAGRESVDWPGALTERTPEPPPAAPVAIAAEVAVEPATVTAMAAAPRPEDARWPVAGQLQQGFGWAWSPTYQDYRFHQGVDYRVADGAEVRAALPGEVRHVGQDRLWAYRVELDHGQNLRTVYAHLGQVKVRAGDWVEAGHVIGRIGPPGEAELADGIHLHFELHVGGKAVDPGVYLK